MSAGNALVAFAGPVRRMVPLAPQRGPGQSVARAVAVAVAVMLTLSGIDAAWRIATWDRAPDVVAGVTGPWPLMHHAGIARPGAECFEVYFDGNHGAGLPASWTYAFTTDTGLRDRLSAGPGGLPVRDCRPETWPPDQQPGRDAPRPAGTPETATEQEKTPR